MTRLPQPLRYFAELRAPRLVLWCYLIWYLGTVALHFDREPRIWLNSLGISAIIGLALLLSLTSVSRDPWQTFRLFLMPFCVSSFSSLIKGLGFFLIFPPRASELAILSTAIATFLAGNLLLKRFSTLRSSNPGFPVAN